MNKEYYVYAYYRLDTNEIFYIGKGKGNRCYNLYNRSKHFTNIINKVETSVTILIDNLTEAEAFYYEEEVIKILVFDYGYSIDIEGNRSNEDGCNLTNSTWGGEGCSNVKSEKTKRKLSLAMKGKNVRGKGFKVSDDTRAKMSKAANHKPVVCVEMNSVFMSTMDAAYFMVGYDTTRGSMIAKACTTPTRTVYNYHWRYATEADMNNPYYDVYTKDGIIEGIYEWDD